MKISGMFVLIAQSLIAQSACAWLAAAVRGVEPIVLSFGAGLMAHWLNDQRNRDEQLFDV